MGASVFRIIQGWNKRGKHLQLRLITTAIDGTLKFEFPTCIECCRENTFQFADICSDKEGDTQAKSVPFLGELVQEDNEEGCRDELDDEEIDTCTEVGGLAIEACEDVGNCLGKGVGDCKGSGGLAVEACKGIDDCLGEGVGDCKGSEDQLIVAGQAWSRQVQSHFGNWDTHLWQNKNPLDRVQLTTCHATHSSSYLVPTTYGLMHPQFERLDIQKCILNFVFPFWISLNACWSFLNSMQ